MAVTPTTWNPADKDSTVTLSEGDTIASSTAGGVRSVFGATSGKFCVEVNYPGGATSERVGVATASYVLSGPPGDDSDSFGYDAITGQMYSGGVVVATAAETPSTTWALLIDLDGGTLGVMIAGVVDTGISVSLPASTLYLAFGGSGSVEGGFGTYEPIYMPPAGYERGFGEPESLDSIIYPQGVSAFKPGAAVAQLGYPASVTPLGASVFSAGTPEALPYAAKILPVPGASVFGAGRPMAIADPIATANATVVAVGVSVFSAGTPTSASAATVQVAGASVFKSGTATASPVVNAVGASLFRAGTPVAAQTARPVGVSVFSAGTPSVTMLAFPLGVSVFRAGTPRTGAAGSVAASGASTFSAGTPKTSVCVHARGQSLFRSGRPSIDRGATC